jgi:hypothetical protein
MMMGPDVGVEARSWPGHFTEQPCVDEQPKIPVDGTQACPWRPADDQSVNFLGGGVRLDAPDNLEHSAAWRGQPESAVPQCRLSTLGFRWARIVRCPSNSHLRDDSHFHQLRPDERHGTSARPPCQGVRAYWILRIGTSIEGWRESSGPSRGASSHRHHLGVTFDVWITGKQRLRSCPCP